MSNIFSFVKFMKNLLRTLACLWLAAVALLFVSSCSNSNELALTSRNFDTQIEPQQNLVFEFAKPVVADSLTNVWDSTQVIAITPRVAGAFKWTSSTTLVFSPSTGFQASTDYKAELTEVIIKNASNPDVKRLSLPKERSFAFHTPYLSLTSADAAWTRAQKAASAGAMVQSGAGFEIRVALQFNYTVTPANLAERLQIMLDGKPTQYELKTNSPGKVVSIGIPADKEAGGKTLQIMIDKGLRCAESQYITPEKLETQVAVPTTDDFKITLVTTDYDEDSPIIRVLTTQSIDEADIKSFVKISPKPQNFDIQLTENGMTLRGAFQPDTAYALTISRNLRGIFGVPLGGTNGGSDYQQTVTFGSLQPGIKFLESKAMYLTSAGNRMIAVRVTGVQKLQVKVEKVYENNILAYARVGYYGDEGANGGNGIRKQYAGGYDEGTGEYNNYEDYAATEDYGDPVFEKTYDVRQMQKQNGYHLLNLNFQDKLPAKGVYIVRVFSADQKWLRDSRVIAISDVGLIAKRSDDEMTVFANSIKTAEPLSGVEVKLVTRNNQALFKATTDKDGMARFTGIRGTTPGTALAMVTANQSGDANYLLLRDTKVETSRYEVGGLYENTAGYQAFIYGDRNIYRPGETVRLNTVVRTQAWEPLADIPVKIKMLLPNGKDYTVLKQTLNKEGAAESAITLPQSALTGLYTIEVYTMNDVLLNARKINIEEFMPDRISVNLNLSAEEVKPGGTLQVNATALNLFGPPAANRDYNLEITLARKQFTAKGLEKYDFTIKGGDKVQLENVFKQGKTDANGMFAETAQIAAAYRDIGLLQGRAFATVFDESGRPVHRMKDFDVPTQEVFFGIKQFDLYQNTRQSMQIPVVAANKAGKPLDNVAASIRVIRTNWITVMEKDTYGSRYRYVSQKQELTELDRTITVSGQGTSIAFTPRQSGEYEVRIAKPGTKTYVSHSFYAYGYGDTQSSSFEVSKEGEITIETDKEQYKVGETANLLFKTPFAGKLLVTVERNKVLEHFYVSTDQKSAKLALPLKDDHIPNVYISATLFKPVDDGASNTPLTVAYGFQSISVEKAATRIPVSISLEEKSRSKTKQTITVTTPESNVEMTIAVVDEGILQIKGYPTPDPHGFFYQKRALQVDSYNLYPYLFPELKLRSSSVAGDAAGMANRVNPFTNKRVKLVALWSGQVKTSGGKASYTIDVPEFSGALRVMAVAYKGKSFGSAEKTMRVADPIVISSALPRFMSPGDEVLMPVTLTNTTNKPAQATAQVESKGLVGVVGSATQSVTIAPNSEAQVLFTLAAARSVGQAEVNVSVSGLGEKFSEKTELTVRPVTSLLKYSGSGSIKGGAKESFALGGAFAGTPRGKLVVSKSPIAQFTKNLSYLIGYPYGCVEQTVSRAFPQLYVADLARSLGGAQSSSQAASVSGQTGEATANVQEAVRKLASMQLYNGSVSYWQGGTEESWWGSAYAAHFLVEAQRAGYDVSEQFQNRLYGYLAKKVKERNYEWYGYYDRANAWRTKYIPAKTLFYSLYVLALANRPDLPTMNYYKANKDSVSLDSRYMLAAAYFLAGDKASYRAVLPKEFTGERSMRAFGGSFYSYMRDEAIALNSLLETDPDNQQIGIMTKHLSDALKNERYLNTQENAFALVALGKLARRAAQTDVQATITAGGKQIAQFSGADVVLKDNIAGAQVSINTSGNGTLYYFWETEGISMEGKFVEEDSFLRVRKTLLSRTGTPLSPDGIKQNDLVIIKLSLASTNGAGVENVVITDMLPAGLEIENPRIASLPEMAWIKDNTEPKHLDIRDDRINLFVTADGTTRNYYYVCRAVTKGTFQMGPVSADAMYNGEYHSYNGAGMLRVSGQ